MSEAENVDDDAEAVEENLAEEDLSGAAEAEIDPIDDVEAVEAAAPAASLAPQLESGPVSEMSRSPAFMGVPIEILICVGKAKPLVSDLVKLRRDSVISLESNIEDPVEIYIGDRLIARGELQEMEDSDGQLGVRLTEVADLSNGV